MILETQMKKIAIALLGSVVSAGVVAAGGAPAAHGVTVRPNSVYCDPGYKRTYKQTSWSWYASDSGKIKNSSKATVHKSISYTFSASLGTTISASIGLSAKTAVAEINAQTSFSVTQTTSVTKSETFSVDVPPHSTITYRDGIVKRTFSVKQVQYFSNCDTRTKTTTVRVGDRYTLVKDA
jgi:hypothetical protein